MPPTHAEAHIAFDATCRWKIAASIQFSQALPGEAKAIIHLIDQAGLEGMVSKRKDSNSTAWLRTKVYSIDEYEWLGVERGLGSRLSP
ncbi:hypothetical protein [Mesorhizobium sp. M1396]|uniref:hypothetical protein n=1 Tax=Mesorhizobium sp. M1396 TaxID=2957095 RepID=UPI003336C59B